MGEGKTNQSNLDEWIGIYKGEGGVQRAQEAVEHVEQIRKGKDIIDKVKYGVFNFTFRRDQPLKEKEKQNCSQEAAYYEGEEQPQSQDQV